MSDRPRQLGRMCRQEIKAPGFESPNQPATAVLSARVKGRGHTRVTAGGSGTAWPSPRPRPLSSAAEAGQFRADAGAAAEEMGEFLAPA